jgi:hypothetical protein
LIVSQIFVLLSSDQPTIPEVIMKKALVAVSVAVVLTGCGGGGGGDSTTTPVPQTASAEGLWIGTTVDNRVVEGFVLDDGSYYAVYSEPFGSSVVGVVQGSGSSLNGTYTTSNARDYYFGSSPYVESVTVTGNYVPMQTINGVSIWPDGSRSTFSAVYDPDYDATPSLTVVAGTYSGEVVGGSESLGVNSDDIVATISTGGTITGSSTYGCSFSGSVAPRTHGNVYNVSIIMGGAPCLFPNQTLTGMLFYRSDTQVTFSVTQTADRSGGLVLLAQKQ